MLLLFLIINSAFNAAVIADSVEPHLYSGKISSAPEAFDSEYERKLAHKASISSDLFGSSVAIYGRRVLVGAPASSSDQAYPNAGNVFVYALSESSEGDQWTELYEIPDPTPAIDDFFGRNVAMGDQRCVVASANRANFFFRSGDFFTDGAESWIFGNSVSGLHYLDNFGAAVAMDGDDLAVVTATSGPNGPYAAVIKYVPNAYGVYRWMISMLVMPSDPLSGFGASAALHGKLLLVGAPSNSLETGEKTGAVHLYELDVSYVYNSYDAAVEISVIRASDKADSHNFGQSLAVYDDEKYEFFAIGANSPYLNFGKVYIFQRFYNASGFVEWTETQQITPSSCSACTFGSTITSSKDFLAVSHSGSVYLYSTPSEDLSIFRLAFALNPLDGKDGESFGKSIALYGQHVAVGAPYGDGYSQGSGAVYVYTETPSGSDGGGDGGGDGGSIFFSDNTDTHVAFIAVAGTVGGFALVIVAVYWLVSPKSKTQVISKEPIDNSATGLMML
jgi:hypothetical protein